MTQLLRFLLSTALVSTIALSQGSCAEPTPTTEVSAADSTNAIRWVQLRAATFNDVTNTLAKSGPDGWNSGAMSARSFVGDGGIEFDRPAEAQRVMVGLSRPNTDPSYLSIDYAIDLDPAGSLAVYESGSRIPLDVRHRIGDRFRVTRTDNIIDYYHMPVGTTAWNRLSTQTTTIDPTVRLVADVSIYSSGGSVNNARWIDYQVTNATPVEWRNFVGGIRYSDVPHQIVKEGGAAAWDAGALSTRSIRGDGGIEFVASETNTHRQIGLSRKDGDSRFTFIDYAVFLHGLGHIALFESNVRVPYWKPYQTGDRFKVTRVGNIVTYYHLPVGTTEWLVMHTSEARIDANIPLVADCAIQSPGGTVSDARWVDLPVTDTDPVAWGRFAGGIRHSSVPRQIVKEGGAAAWDAGALSSRSIRGDGGIEFVASETDTHRLIGLSIEGGDSRFTFIDYAVFLHGLGHVTLFESSARVPYWKPYQTGDRFKVTRAGDVITYYHMPVGTTEWLVMHTSETRIDANVPLVADCAIQSPGGTVSDAQWIGIPNANTNQGSYDVDWIYPEGAEVVAAPLQTTVLSKPGATASMSGAASRRRFTGNGGISFEALETDTRRAVGLSTRNVDARIDTIDFALLLTESGTVNISEGGRVAGLARAYDIGDKFKIVRQGTVVNYYYKPNATHLWQLMHTSATTIDPTVALVADSSLRTQGSTVGNAQWVRLPPDTYDHAVWVWNAISENPAFEHRDGLEDPAFRDTLIERSWQSGVSTLYINLYRSTPSHLPKRTALRAFIASAHRAGIRVVAVYGEAHWHTAYSSCGEGDWPRRQIKNVADWNASVNDHEKIDGVMLDVEPAVLDAPKARALLAFYRCMVDDARDKQLLADVAIRFYWDLKVEFEGSTKPVYAHAIDLFDNTVVMAYRKHAHNTREMAGMVTLAQSEVAYAAESGKHNAVIVGVETCEVCSERSVTFHELGQKAMNDEIDLAGATLRTQYGAALRGFAIHFYGDVYLSDTSEKWPAINDGFPLPREAD